MWTGSFSVCCKDFWLKINSILYSYAEKKWFWGSACLLAHVCYVLIPSICIVEFQWLKHLGSLFVLDMGSSSHWGLVIAPGQEASRENFGLSIRSSINICMLLYLLESPRWGDSNKYNNIHFHEKKRKENCPKTFPGKYLFSSDIERMTSGLKNEFESARVNG